MVSTKGLSSLFARNKIGAMKEDEKVCSSEGPILISSLGHLRSLISQKMNMDPEHMKIIHKGKQIAGKAAEKLKSGTFKEGDKLLIMGKTKAALMDDAAFKELTEYEKAHLLGLQKTYDSLRTDTREYEKGFLEDEKQVEMGQRLEKRMKIFNEVSTRHMVALDAMEMSREGTSKEQTQRNREKRKALINGIETLLNQNDSLVRELEEIKRKREEGNKQ